MTSHDYTACIDGKGYRFTLPSLGLPDPQGEWVTIQAALTTNQLDTLDALNKVKGKTEGVLRSPSEDRVTIDVLHEGATWLLPILQPEGREETQAFTLRVRRLPARGGEDATAQNEELLARAAASLSLNDSPQLTRKPSAVSSSESSSTSESSASPPPSTSHELPVAPTIDPARALNSRPSGSVVSDTEVLGPLSLNFRYKDHFDWSFHFNPTILHLQYLDVLPQGDPIPPKLVPYHREAGANWSVDFTQRILYHRPAIPPGLRNKHWQALLSSTGLECDIGRGMMTINLGLQRHNYVKLPLPQQLSNGAARLKVIPNPPNYACQPSAASAEASYFLNRYQLLIEQNGKTIPALNPSAAYLPFNEEILLCLLGQAASASAPDSAAARMVFEQHPPKLEGVAELLNVGVRLRDGGSRYPIIMRERKRRGKRERKARFLLPGKAIWHVMYGGYDCPPFNGDKAKQDKTREVTLRTAIPQSQKQQDVILRVRDQEEGKYDVLECAFRARGDFVAVKEEEWQEVGPEGLGEEWAREFLINMARESSGVDVPVGVEE